MATVEHIDEIALIITNRDEQVALETAMEALGAERDDVGGGIVLFLLDRGVILRTREALPN